MEAASLAATVTYQTTAEQDVSRRTLVPPPVVETEKSSAQTDQDVLLVIHTPEPKDKTLSASQTNVVPTKSSPG
jgi:hypothetical protein